MPSEAEESTRIWPYPVVESGSKLGVHSIRPNEIGQFTQNAVAGSTTFPVVKAVDDLGWLAGIREMSPNSIIVARLTSRWEGCPRVEQPSTDLDELANNLLDVILHKLDQDPGLREVVDYWEICNEPDPPGTEGYRRLSLLMIRCIELAEAQGLKLGIFALCAGTPEWNEMEAMVSTGVFGRAREGEHILTLHEGVFDDDPIDKWWGDLIPGAPEVEGAGALCFRYRYLYHLLRQQGQILPLIMSEIGLGGGYESDQTAQEVVQRVRWYDERAREDYWVLGFCPFTLGPMGGWADQDYEFAYPALVEYMISIKDEPNALPEEPSPLPRPKPSRGKPRDQYKRTYVLLPPSAGSEWAHAVVEATWDDKRFTVGASADDAGIGDLDHRNVIAVNPSRWEKSLKAFFEKHYSDVRYIPVEAETSDELRTRLRSIEL
jgi:hypothetical protein